jgi:molybdopterin converting factor small subunit
LKVKVLYFASAQGLTNLQSEYIRLREGSLVKDVSSEMFRLHPALKSLERTIRFTVNFVLVGEEDPLHDGDEVGVLPSVAGG